MLMEAAYNAKGLSALLSAILLIAIVTITSIFILNWISSLTKKETAQITNKSLDCTSAGVSIQRIFIDLAANRSRVTVHNSGFQDDTIIDATVLNTAGQDAPNLTVFPINFPRGAIETIEFNTSGKIAACSNFSRAIVSTRCTGDDQSLPLTCG
jgi:hypothetical protein